MSLSHARFLGLFVAGSLAIGAAGCGKRGLGGSGVQGSGVAKTESRPVADVNEVELDGVGTLELAIASTPSLTVTADDNVLPVLTTRVDHGKLSIGATQEVRTKTPIVYRFAGPAVRAIALQGAGDVHARGWRGDDLAVSLSGTGSIEADGEVSTLSVSLTGTGDVNAAALTAKVVKIRLSGVGDAKVNAMETLNVDLSGTGTVLYKGGATLTKHVSGVGSVEAL